MRRYPYLSAALVAVIFATAQLPVHGQATDNPATTSASAKPKHKAKAHRESAEEMQMRALKESLKAQQDQIDALKAQVTAKSGETTAAQQTAADAQAQATAAAASAAQAQAAAAATSSRVDAVSSSVTDLKTTTAGLNDTVVAGQKKMQSEIMSPSTLRYKGIAMTPIAFAALEGVWRQHSMNSDINTPFNAVPFPGANEGHVDEINFSGRQSRLAMLFMGDAGTYKLSGYFEMDFLGSGTTSNNNQSNSYVLRQRQIWGKFESAGGFTLTGGQMWSLVTEDRKGTDARTEIQPQTIDPQYLVGYTWTRQPAIRVQQRFGNYETGALTVAASAEQAQITGFTVQGSAAPTDYFFGGIGQSGGLYNAAAANGGASNITTYANNVVPDMIVKAAYDLPKMHIEGGGLARFMRDNYLPVTSTGGTASAETYTYGTQYQSHTSPAGGAYGSVRVYPDKYFEVAVQAMGGQGVGRYGSAQLADATLRPDETLEPLRNYHGMFTLMTHPTKKLDVFTYYGGEYDQRTVYTTGEGALIGYGPRNISDTGCYALPPAPSTSAGAGVGGSLGAPNCGSPTRYIQEPMIGFIYRAIDSPSYGRLQYWVTYSYLQRNLWSGVGNATSPSGPRAEDPMIHVSLRYYIP